MDRSEQLLLISRHPCPRQGRRRGRRVSFCTDFRQGCRNLGPGHLYRMKRRQFAPWTKTWIPAPHEDHVGIQPVPARYRRNRSPSFKRLSHNPPLECLRVAPPLPLPPDLIRHDKRPRILSGHDRPLSRPNSHSDHRGIKVGSAGRLHNNSAHECRASRPGAGATPFSRVRPCGHSRRACAG